MLLKFIYVKNCAITDPDLTAIFSEEDSYSSLSCILVLSTVLYHHAFANSISEWTQENQLMLEGLHGHHAKIAVELKDEIFMLEGNYNSLSLTRKFAT